MIARAQVTPKCTHNTYRTIEVARNRATSMSRNLRARIAAVRCEDCGLIMVEAASPRGTFDKIDIRILRYLISGLRDRDIAEDMDLAEYIIRKRVSDMFQRSETNSRAQLVAFAISKGVVDCGPSEPSDG